MYVSVHMNPQNQKQLNWFETHLPGVTPNTTEQKHHRQRHRRALVRWMLPVMPKGDGAAVGFSCSIPWRSRGLKYIKRDDWQHLRGFPGGSAVKEPTCQRRKHGFDPWVGKMPCRKEWQPTLVLLPWRIPRTEEPGGL